MLAKNVKSRKIDDLIMTIINDQGLIIRSDLVPILVRAFKLGHQCGYLIDLEMEKSDDNDSK